MNPDTRMAVSLVLSLVVSAQNLRLAALGHADIVDVGLRYVAAFLIAFVVVGTVGRVFNDYLASLETDEETTSDEAEDAAGPSVDGMRLADESGGS